VLSFGMAFTRHLYVFSWNKAKYKVSLDRLFYFYGRIVRYSSTVTINECNIQNLMRRYLFWQNSFDKKKKKERVISWGSFILESSLMKSIDVHREQGHLKHVQRFKANFETGCPRRANKGYLPKLFVSFSKTVCGSTDHDAPWASSKAEA